MIFQRRVRQLQKWGHLPIIFANFPPKVHEIEDIWTDRGRRTSLAPSPPWIRQCYHTFCAFSYVIVIVDILAIFKAYTAHGKLFFYFSFVLLPVAV